MDAIIVIRNIAVENANAVSGKTRGFPAISHFLGYMYALQRCLTEKSRLDMSELRLSGCGVVYHEQGCQAENVSEQTYSLAQPPMIKEGRAISSDEDRMDLTVSLVISVTRLPVLNDVFEIIQLEKEIKQLAESRLAGGTVSSISSVSVVRVSKSMDVQERQVAACFRTLLPGFALVSRSDLQSEPSLLFSGTNYSELERGLLESNFQGETIGEVSASDNRVRPIPVGYKVISPLYPTSEVDGSDEKETSVCYVETIYSLGEWVRPQRIKRFDEIMWSYSAESNHSQLCRNSYKSESVQEELAQHDLNLKGTG